MREILGLKKTNCKSCHKCIRNCAVKSIRFTAGQAHIVEDECILCGRCFAGSGRDCGRRYHSEKRIREDTG